MDTIRVGGWWAQDEITGRLPLNRSMSLIGMPTIALSNPRACPTLWVRGDQGERAGCEKIQISQAGSEIHAVVSNFFNLGRHMVSANHYRVLRLSALEEWSWAVACIPDAIKGSPNGYFPTGLSLSSEEGDALIILCP